MIKKFSLLIIVILTMSSCSSSEGGEQVITDGFDRGAMLVNIADNIIIPAYEDFNTKMNSLKSAGDSFVANPNQTNLDSFRSAWLTAYKTWQYVEMFNIGKAEELQYSFYMNIYPLTVSDVEENIANGSYDLNSVNNHDAQGFPALDYLLYGVDDTDAKILEKYTTATNNDNYKKYITDVLNQMSTLTNTVVSDFKTQRDTFVVSTQNTATSVVNKLINDYIFYYEKGLRANKLGIPAGVFSNTTLPNKVEGFYKNDVSKELSLEALTAVKNLFEGTSYNGNSNGLSFKNYLIQLEREDIASAITTQLAAATSEINKLDNSFTVQVNSDNTAMTKSYDELQKVVVYFKVDMLQAFNINVDYVDADGD